MVSPYPAISIGGAALRAAIPPAGIGTPGFFSANAGPSPFTQFAGGLQNVAQNFAAGFGRDPQRRAEAMRQLELSQQQQQAEAEAKREQQKQRLDLLYGSFKSVVAGLQGVGAIPTGTQRILEKMAGTISQVAGDPVAGQDALDWAQAMAQLPATSDDFTQKVNALESQLGRKLTPDELTQLGGARVAPDTGATQLAKLKSDLDAGRITPQQYQAAVRKETYIPPTGETASDAQARERDRLIATGVDPVIATKAAAGVLQLSQPDVEGNVSVIDLTSGQPIATFNAAQVAQTEAAKGQVPSGEQPYIPPLSEDVSKATGAASNVQAILSGTVGQLPSVGRVAPETMDARQRVALFERSAQQALVNNPRFPQGEQEVVRGMIPTAGEWTTDPEDAVAKVANLQNYLIQRKQSINDSLGNARLTRDARGILTDQLAAIDRVLQMMRGMGTKPTEGNVPEDLLTKDPTEWTDEDIKRATDALGQ